MIVIDRPAGLALVNRQKTAEPPVFLIGCHRSGTTLARRLLDAHPRLCCPPESKAFMGLDALVKYPQVLLGLSTLGVKPSGVYRHFRGVALEVFGTYAAARGKARWVDKTPNYYRLLPLIDRVFCRRVRFLFMVRHPIDVCGSMQHSDYFGHGPVHDADIAATIRAHGRSAVAWASYWHAVNRRLVEFARRHPGRTFMFRYEDLVRWPELILERVLASIGEPLTDGLVSEAFRRPLAAGFGDWKARSSKSITTEALFRGLSLGAVDVEEIWKRVSTDAEELGYGVGAEGPTYWSVEALPWHWSSLQRPG